MFTYGMFVLVCHLSANSADMNDCDWFVVDSFKTERECLHDINHRGLKGFKEKGFVIDSVVCNKLDDNPDFE